MKFIIKPFSEIMIKSKPVRKRLLQTLQYNLNLRVKALNSNLKVSIFYDKLELNIKDPDGETEFDLVAIKKALSRTPGIESFLEVESHEICDFDAILEKAAEVYLNQIKDKSFVVRVKRSGKHDFTSVELERYVGAGLLKKLDTLGIHGKVDVKTPEIKVAIEVKDENLYIVKNTGYGMGGYPTGAQDKIISLISGGFDSGVSTYSMMKRGCKVDFLFFNLGGSAHELGVKQVAYFLNNQFSVGYSANIITVPFEKLVRELVTNIHHKYRAIILKRCMLKIADQISQEQDYYAIVKGDSLGQVSSQTLKNMFVIDKASDTLVLRPLIAFNKQEIVNITKQIGTYDFACNMPEYCGVISDKPSTGAKLEDVLKEEKNLDLSILEEAFINKKVAKVTDVINQIQTGNNDIEYSNFALENDVVIDVRDPENIKKKPLVIEGKENLEIPFYDINNVFKDLDQSKTYLLYCDKGVMSKLHGLYLKEKGFGNVKVFKVLEKDKTCGTL
ncbi:tRNA 4-thiouridine(8) synthase ThiI [Candidatus Gracilibacteria bacterium 28_42_T64]|nr:tRNA 4-thiouridine(8) synthase ThiI [Candidatus Gracilibacteria bacterium 28_42_T64]